MAEIFIPKIRKISVCIEGQDVILVENGQIILSLSWTAAIALANAMKIQARRIEELVKAQQIISDQALLMRAGIPIGLSANPQIMKEAKKEAIWNRELRRAIPSIRPAEKFGVPALQQEPPKAQSLGVSGIPTDEKFGKI